MDNTTLCPLRFGQGDKNCIGKDCAWYMPAFAECAALITPTILLAENNGLRIDMRKLSELKGKGKTL